jgi:magnesium transporter
MDVVESYRDVLSGLTDSYRQHRLAHGEIMQVLTVVSSIFFPDLRRRGWCCTHMPELAERYGYAVCLLFMFLIAIGQLIYFKKRRWL